MKAVRLEKLRRNCLIHKKNLRTYIKQEVILLFKIKRILSIVITIVLCFALSACKKEEPAVSTKKAAEGTTYPLKIKDSYDREVTIDKEPQRIISIAPNITETIFVLGKGDKLVGRTDYCDFPSEAGKVTSVGKLTDPSLEKIVELKPDVVIASTHFKKEVVTKLEQLNIKVLVLYGPESFDGVYETITKVAQVLNAKEAADKVTVDMKKKVDAVTAKVKDAKKPSVYYVVGFGKSGDFTAGKGTFIANMIDMAGGVNAANDVEGWKYSLEKLVEKNPDILVCSKSFDTKKGLEAANGYKDLSAVKGGKLLEIDENLLNRQGPRLAEGLETLAKLIHPEIFK
jgi:iron complex transport system substrate-binding protein